MIRTIHKIISFPNRISGRARLFASSPNCFERFLLIIFTVFRFLSPRFVSPRSKLPIPFVLYTRLHTAFTQLFSRGQIFAHLFIYFAAEYYISDPCRNETFIHARRKGLFTTKLVLRIIALCKWNTCKRRIGEKEGGMREWNREVSVQRNIRVSFFYSCVRNTSPSIGPKFLSNLV